MAAHTMTIFVLIYRLSTCKFVAVHVCGCCIVTQLPLCVPCSHELPAGEAAVHAAVGLSEVGPPGPGREGTTHYVPTEKTT